MVMMYSTSITQKGQITIPVHIRKKLGLKTGQKVGFTERDKEVVIEPVPNFLDLIGSLKTKKKYDKRKARKAIGEYLAQRYVKSTS